MNREAIGFFLSILFVGLASVRDAIAHGSDKELERRLCHGRRATTSTPL